MSREIVCRTWTFVCEQVPHVRVYGIRRRFNTARGRGFGGSKVASIGDEAKPMPVAGWRNISSVGTIQEQSCWRCALSIKVKKCRQVLCHPPCPPGTSPAGLLTHWQPNRRNKLVRIDGAGRGYFGASSNPKLLARRRQKMSRISAIWCDSIKRW